LDGLNERARNRHYQPPLRRGWPEEKCAKYAASTS